MDISLGICGTAGRKSDAKILSKQHFEAMCSVTLSLMKECGERNYPISTLVSGGAAYADFVAVQLFLNKKVKLLKLFLPAPWENGTFKDNGDKSPGSVANFYHHKFQRTTGINSLSKMQSALVEGAEFIIVEKGFYARNYLVAKESDFLLAITFGNKQEVKANSGSAHCVKCYLDKIRKESIFDKSFHYDLNDGIVYQGCTLSKHYENSPKK